MSYKQALISKEPCFYPVSINTGHISSDTWKSYTPKSSIDINLILEGDTDIQIKQLVSLLQQEKRARFLAESKLAYQSAVIHLSHTRFANKFKEWMDELAESSTTITDHFACATPNKYDLKFNNERIVSNINIGSWWKTPMDRRKWDGKGYPVISNPADRCNIKFQTILQSYLGRLRELALYGDFDTNHVDQLTRVAVALRVRITSDNHPDEYPAIFKIHQIWNNANPGIIPPTYLPFVRWTE
ncbi:MAG: hypothetical protein O3B87_05420 [bacterium]|nr:hypothetical protein [bacterium]